MGKDDRIDLTLLDDAGELRAWLWPSHVLSKLPVSS
jgi:hypothetical protein